MFYSYSTFTLLCMLNAVLHTQYVLTQCLHHTTFLIICLNYSNLHSPSFLVFRGNFGPVHLELP